MRKEWLLFLSMVIIAILPVWTVAYFPTQDGPNHLWILDIISRYSDQNGHLLRQFIVPNGAMEPNLGFYVIAYPLSLLFGLAMAEKLFLTLVAVFFCYGVRYALSKINHNALALSYLSVPMVFSGFLHKGFYNFILGMALFLPILTFCIVQYHKETILDYWKIGVAGLILVLAHLVPFAVFVFAFGLYVLAYRIVDMARLNRVMQSIRQLASEAGWLAVALLPSALIAGSFVLRHGVTDNPTPSTHPLMYYAGLIRLAFLKSFDVVEEIFMVWPYQAVLVVAIALVAWSVYRHRHISTQAIALFVMSLGLLILYLYVPVTSKNLSINPRLAPFVLLAGIILLSALSGAARLSSVIFLSIAVILTGAGYRYIQYNKLEKEINQVLSLSTHIEPYSTFLPIRLTAELSPFKISDHPFNRADVLRHVGAHIAIARQSIYLGSSLLSPAHFAYFPYIFRKETDPFALLGLWIELPSPKVDFAKFRLMTGHSVDYIILFGTIHELPELHEEVKQIQKELDQNYRMVTSSQNGRYSLYESKTRHPSETPILIN